MSRESVTVPISGSGGMEKRLEELKKAARAGCIDELYALLKEDDELLEWYDKKAVIDTPFHIAASEGCTHFALEILRLKPSLGKKLNPDGLSPLHLAVRKGHKKTAERLAHYEPELVRVQGKEGITPLHCVAKSSDSHLLAEFLMACPASVEYSTIRGETAVHVAVTQGSVEAFKVLLGWLQHTDNIRILNRKDENGDTALHLAARAGRLEILRLLIEKVNINEKNLKEQTAKDIATEEENQTIIDALKKKDAPEGKFLDTYKSWAHFLTSKPESCMGHLEKSIIEPVIKFDAYMEKGLSDNNRAALLVVAVLVATATYQALLQPPGGLSQGGSDNLPFYLLGTYSNGTARATIKSNQSPDDDVGKAVMRENDLYVFIILNSIAFAASLGSIAVLLPRHEFNKLIHISLLFTFCNYMWNAMVISPERASDVILYILDAASVLYLLIVGTTLLKLVGSWFPSVVTNCSHVYDHAKKARQVYLLKYRVEGTIIRDAS